MRFIVATPQVQVTLTAVVSCAAPGCHPLVARRRKRRGAWGRAA